MTFKTDNNDGDSLLSLCSAAQRNLFLYFVVIWLELQDKSFTSAVE